MFGEVVAIASGVSLTLAVIVTLGKFGTLFG